MLRMLFDGDCGICTASAEWVNARDKGATILVRPYQSYSDAELAQWGLTPEMCSQLLQVVDGAGRVHSGANAINMIGLSLEGLSPLATIPIFFPPILWAEHVVYGIVAANRTKISTMLKMKACGTGFKPAKGGVPTKITLTNLNQ